MYTVVFKQKVDDTIIFDVFHKPLLGRQRIIGNVFCKKNTEKEYKTITSIYMSSWPNKYRWDGGKRAYYIEKIAREVCNNFIKDSEWVSAKTRYENKNS